MTDQTPDPVVIDTSPAAVERLAQEFDARVRLYSDMITGPMAHLRQGRAKATNDTHAATAATLRALLAERDTAVAQAREEGRRAGLEEVAREVDCSCHCRHEVLATPPNSPVRWRACGNPNCAALEAEAIRARIPADASREGSAQ